MPGAFISYVRENSETVQRLAEALGRHRIEVWLDQDQIKPGFRWKDAIREAISQGDFFIACFSAEYGRRLKTYMNEELTLAIEELRQRPVDRAWFIPVLLSDCDVPNRSIGAGETLRSIQWVALHQNWDDGIRRILSVIQPNGMPTNRTEVQDNSTSMAALKALSERLLSQLCTLPFSKLDDRAIRNAVLWQDHDLHRLETLAESTEAFTMSLVSRLITHLRFIKTKVEEIRRVDPRIGYNYDRLFPFEQWADNFQEARTSLQTLVGNEMDAGIAATSQQTTPTRRLDFKIKAGEVRHEDGPKGRIETLSRRLRVRDDGTGKIRDIDSTFADFETEDAIILLGDPGMGKTTLFRAVSNTNSTTVRNFLIDPHATSDEPIFLDALDEYRTLVSGQDASDEVAKALVSLKKPKFRLSCRAADWFGSRDQDVLRAASASGRVVILELCPLSRDEILNAVQEKVPDPVVFLDEAESAGLGHLLGNPQTLELVAVAWGTDRKPRNKFEAYEKGVSELLKEMNPNHVVRGASSPDPSELRKAASAAASTLLLSNSVGISRVEPADGNGYIRFSVVPHPNKSDLDAVLRRRLFTSLEVDRFEPIHRTIAEFLAAEDLAQRIEGGLPIDRVMALICGIDGRPVSSLRGLFAWLMCKLGNRVEGYVERDPYGVATYGDASVLSPNAQCEIWAGLRKLRDPWFLTNEDDRGSFRGLANLNSIC